MHRNSSGLHRAPCLILPCHISSCALVRPQRKTHRFIRNHTADGDSLRALLEGHPTTRRHRGCLREAAVVRATESLARNVYRNHADYPEAYNLFGGVLRVVLCCVVVCCVRARKNRPMPQLVAEVLSGQRPMCVGSAEDYVRVMRPKGPKRLFGGVKKKAHKAVLSYILKSRLDCDTPLISHACAETHHVYLSHIY